MRFKKLVLLSVLMGAPGSMFGQTAAGTLTGIVTDPSGAVIAGLTVTATHVETGTKIVATTSQTGNYTMAQMPVGKYEVAVAQAGFKSVKQENVIIAAAQTLRLDIQLEVGAASESVTVSAESTLLQADTGALVKNITPEQIQNLPVLPVTTFIRDPLALALTLPGSVNGGTGFGPRINGISNADNQYKIDGEPVTNVGANTITTRNNVSPDAIQEVAIQSSNFNAEFGSVSAALFNIVVKSGTNHYHGTAYDYIANDKFNADDAGSHARNRVRRNDYGFNVGGPVWVPKLYNGKDKTFFFFNWEQYRDFETHTADINPIPTVPTQAYRNGDFSGLLTVPGVTGNLKINGHDYKDPFGNTIPLGTIFDPRTTQFNVPCNTALTQDCVAGTLLTVRAPFAGNLVPATMIDSVSAAILKKYVPLPQGPNAAAGILTSNYLNGFKASRVTRSPALKIDHNLGTKARISFTWSDNHTESPIQTVAPGAFAEGFPEPITHNAGTFEASPTFRVNVDYNLKPTMLLHFGVGWQEFNFCNCAVTTNYNAASEIGLTGATLAQTTFPSMNSTVVSSPQLGGLNTIGTFPQAYNLERHPSASANLSYLRGNHTYKIGVDARMNSIVIPSTGNTAGTFSFGTSSATALTGNGITWQPALNGLTGFTGFSGAVGFPFANWLMGSVTSLTLAVPTEYRKSREQYGLYIQDTWRVRRNLTIDYGIRWDYGTYAKEQYGRVADFSLTTPNPAADGRPGAYLYEQTCKCQFAQNYPYAVAPRFGIAYTLNSKTVFRGGAGIAYDAVPFTPGGIINAITTPTLPNGFDDFKLQGGIPRDRYQPAWPVFNPSFSFTPGVVNPNNATLVDPNAGRPDRTYQWNIAIQREITRNTVLEVAYVGNRNIWNATTGFQDFNAVSVATLQHYGFTVDGSPQGIADEKLLNSKLNQLSASQQATLAQRGIAVPYSSFPSSGAFVQTVFQSLRPYPQFNGGTALSPSAPQGKSWYDSLQMTLTKRFSHGLSATGGYTFSKNLAWTGAPDIFNPDVYTKNMGKDLVAANPPQILRISFEYQVPRYKGNMPVLGNRVVSYVLGDWALSSALYYQTAAYLTRPASGSANAVSLWLGRGPGGAQLKKNADGSFMSPWSVDWYDLSGKHHTDPLDINCHCFDPAKTIVLNPAAWQTIPDGTWTADTSTYPFFRGQRHPSESMNFARNFKFVEKYTLQIRIEFQNVFNRVQLPSPTGLAVNGGLGAVSPVNPTYQTAANGNYISGFGTFGNLAAGSLLGTPRTGQLVARFSF